MNESMRPQPVIVHVIIRFSRRSVECEKIALASLHRMEPSEYSRRAIAELSAEIAEKEKILDEHEGRSTTIMRPRAVDDVPAKSTAGG